MEDDQRIDANLLGSEPRNDGDLKSRVWVEVKKIWRVGFPSMLARVSQFGMFVVTQAFIGKFGEEQLAGYALVQIIAVRFVNGILLGMSSATETLCGQAFGAKQYHMMGVYLQRSFMINLATATILLPLFIFAKQIFCLLGENDDVAAVAGYISLWFIPILYFFAFVFCIQKFLQCQLKNMVVGWISAISFILHILLSWIFVSKLNWGIPGAMASMIIASWLVVVVEVVYVLGGWCPITWKGFTWAAFSHLVPVLTLSISSGIMLCLEFWYNAILVIIAGYMKNATTQISALSICLNITAWELTFCIGFLTAASVRVSNELGRGDAKAAKFSVKVLFSISICLGVVFFTLCLLFSRQIALVFTSEEDIVEAVSELSLLLAFSVLLNSLQTILTGVAVGTGRQALVAYINIVCYYVVGIPVGVVLGYVAELQVKGVWIGMIVGVVLQVTVLGYVTFRTNWDQQVKHALERVNRWLPKPTLDESTDDLIGEERLLNG